MAASASEEGSSRAGVGDLVDGSEMASEDEEGSADPVKLLVGGRDSLARPAEEGSPGAGVRGMDGEALLDCPGEFVTAPADFRRVGVLVVVVIVVLLGGSASGGEGTKGDGASVAAAR